MWRDIKDYEGLYEINENAVVRRVEGKGIDGRKVTTHVVVSSKTRKGTRYIALWKEWKSKDIHASQTVCRGVLYVRK